MSRRAVLAAFGLAVLAPSARAELALWVRAPEGKEPTVQKIAWESLSLVERELVDPQYGGRTARYRGVELQALLERFAPGKSEDTAVLHFDNGMRVPVPFRDAAAMSKLGIFVARQVELAGAGGEPRRWTELFPPLGKAGAEQRDRRPITFHGNKLVVRTLWHPAVDPRAQPHFSPWQHVDSLAGIELVKKAAYDRQFRARAPAAARGQAVFAGRCEFCHGVRDVGATYGWDFASPVPLHKHRDAQNLVLHVRYRELDAPEKGLMMPSFPELTEKDVAALWTWMEAIAREGPKPYAP
jgi:mono/diheme cytochrome c family protein